SLACAQDDEDAIRNIPSPASPENPPTSNPVDAATMPHHGYHDDGCTRYRYTRPLEVEFHYSAPRVVQPVQAAAVAQPDAPTACGVAQATCKESCSQAGCAKTCAGTTACALAKDCCCKAKCACVKTACACEKDKCACAEKKCGCGKDCGCCSCKKT